MNLCAARFPLESRRKYEEAARTLQPEAKLKERKLAKLRIQTKPAEAGETAHQPEEGQS
jgi:hypothetical protein